MHALDIFLRVVGAFYMFAGFVLARSVMTSRLFDQAIAAITFKGPSTAERLKERYSIALALVVFASGLALICLAHLAVYLFLVGSALQAVFIFWIAPRYVDEPDDDASPGRRQSTNALVLYAAMTTLIAWAAQMDRLRAWPDLDDVVKMAAAVALAAFAAHLAWTYVRMTLHKPRRDWHDIPTDEDSQDPKA